METTTSRQPFWIFLLCAFTQIVTFLFLYLIGWSIINHFYTLSGKFDWGLIFMLALFAFFGATCIQWLTLYFTQGTYLTQIFGLILVIMVLLIYSSYFPVRSLFLLGCLLIGMLFSRFLYFRLNERAMAMDKPLESNTDDLLDDERWD